MSNLFIGGPEDGARLTVSDESRLIRFSIPELRAVPERYPQRLDVVDIREEVYRRAVLESDGHRTEIFVHSSVADRDIIEKLVRGYHT